MKKILYLSLVAVLSLTALVGCNKNGSLLNSKKPVTLTMWHVYGEHSDSPMDRYVTEFNRTVGKEKGIIINITDKSNASEIGEKLLNAQKGKAGTTPMPDLFFCHTSNAIELGINNLVNWKEVFSQTELDKFIGGFLKDGTAENSLAVLPVSKSTHLLFYAGSVFERFANAKNVSVDDLKTWDGFFAVAEKYYEYSGGKPFCALDFFIRSVELDAISRGANDFYTENGWYKENATLLASYKKFASSIAKGHIVVSDEFSNTQVMTGATLAGISSSAAVLYYNDVINYPDTNVVEEMNLKVLPVPQAGVGVKYATQAGVGLCAYKTTAQKTEAASIFAKWFTEEKRNLDFVAQTGYMPVKNGAFDKLATYNFKTAAFKNTYLALNDTRSSCTFLPEPSINGYYSNTYTLYNEIRALQKDIQKNGYNGKSAQDVANEIVDFFLNIGK